MNSHAEKIIERLCAQHPIHIDEDQRFIKFSDGSIIEYWGNDPHQELKITQSQLIEIVDILRFNSPAGNIDDILDEWEEEIREEITNDVESEYQDKIDDLEEKIENLEFDIEDLKEQLEEGE